MAYMDNLIETAVEITPNTVAVYPLFNREERVQVENLIPEFQGCFCLSNGVVAFICEGKFFVTPFTQYALYTLQHAGLRQNNFEVPFSDNAYPKAEKCRWAKLLSYAISQQSCIA